MTVLTGLAFKISGLITQFLRESWQSILVDNFYHVILKLLENTGIPRSRVTQGARNVQKSPKSPKLLKNARYLTSSRFRELQIEVLGDSILDCWYIGAFSLKIAMICMREQKPWYYMRKLRKFRHQSLRFAYIYKPNEPKASLLLLYPFPKFPWIEEGIKSLLAWLDSDMRVLWSEI